MLLLNLGIRKDAAVSVSKESMNKSNSKYVFLRFYVLTFLQLLLAAYRGVFRTWSKSTFNTNDELSQNHTEKQFISSKSTTNWLFDICCYFITGCFN